MTAARRWRDYQTRNGARPVKAFLDELTDEEVAAVIAGMKEVAQRGLSAARHLRGHIYEVRAEASTRASECSSPLKGGTATSCSRSPPSRNVRSERPTESLSSPRFGCATGGRGVQARGADSCEAMASTLWR